MKTQLRVIALFLLLLGVAGIALVGSAVPAYADAPTYQPFEYPMVRCSGLGSVANVDAALQDFNTWYGFQHQLTTDAQWQWSYVARVNEFANTVGCPQVLEDDGTKSGRLTFAYRVYVPWYAFYAHARNIPE